MITDYNHVSFTVSNLDRSIDFYTKAFGFTFLQRFESIGSKVAGYPDLHSKVVFLQLGGLNLELIEYVNPRGEHRPVLETKDVGTAHFALTCDDVHVEYERLKKMGVRFKSEPQVSKRFGTMSVYGLDPDGITFELRSAPW